MFWQVPSKQCIATSQGLPCSRCIQAGGARSRCTSPAPQGPVEPAATRCPVSQSTRQLVCLLRVGVWLVSCITLHRPSHESGQAAWMTRAVSKEPLTQLSKINLASSSMSRVMWGEPPDQQQALAQIFPCSGRSRAPR